MKTLNKILTVGLFALTSLTGCMKSYRIDGKVVEYNKRLMTPMVVYSDTAKVSYSSSWSSFDEAVNGNEISVISVAKAKPFYFGGRSVQYNHFPKRFSIYNPKDSAIMSRERENFDYFLHKIDSIEKGVK